MLVDLDVRDIDFLRRLIHKEVRKVASGRQRLIVKFGDDAHLGEADERRQYAEEVLAKLDEASRAGRLRL